MVLDVVLLVKGTVMSRFEKLIQRIRNNPQSVRFAEIEKILLINISADNAQKAVCSRFCEEFHNASFTDTEKIKNFFPKTIDFTENI